MLNESADVEKLLKTYVNLKEAEGLRWGKGAICFLNFLTFPLINFLFPALTLVVIVFQM